MTNIVFDIIFYRLRATYLQKEIHALSPFQSTQHYPCFFFRFPFVAYSFRILKDELHLATEIYKLGV